MNSPLRSRICRHLRALFLVGLLAAATGSTHGEPQPVAPAILPLDALTVGDLGEVWTVFRGTEPEPFAVEVTGIIHNALGPGKAMILCELTDERVQHMGAVAGMSGSPLYIDGKLAGALSYQVQRFETVRFAGFTPVEDLLEVRRIALQADDPPLPAPPLLPAGGVSTSSMAPPEIQPLSPVFSMGGISPQVHDQVVSSLQSLGIRTTQLGGSLSSAHAPDTTTPTLAPGQAVAAALAVGDITLAGTGTVSQVDGNRVLAFGHPLLGLGEVEMPMLSAEIVTILPSNMNSVKISNTGDIIGTVRQDRLSAIYGEVGTGPDLVPITITTPGNRLEFATVKHPRLTPMITVVGLSQAVMGSNDAGLAEGFSITTAVTFADDDVLTMENLYAGPQSFAEGMKTLTADLSTWLQNPVEEAFPEQVHFSIHPLARNPLASLDNLRLSHRSISPGETLEVTLFWRDFQSERQEETVRIPISADWVGRKLEVVVTNGRNLDLMTGGQRRYAVSQIRNFSAYVSALRAQRPPDGLRVALVGFTSLFMDQTHATPELPGSLARIAQTADEARFSQRQVREVLWETEVLPRRLVPGSISQALVVNP